MVSNAQAEVRDREKVVGQLETYPDLLTVNEVAQILRLAPLTVYRYTWSGALPAIRIGPDKSGVRIKREAVAAFIEGNVGAARK